ncbi:hypothetical protein [Cytophaga aurantiaca]|uniref:hypothetical protein n=1 Tax=Cytophaga aurantiaca TaxID=29530 RepID=UPI0003767756|nr:hypothetical protein [Cytophaga aurantiaca]
MRTNRFIKKSAIAIIVVSMLFFAFASRANSLSHKHSKNYTEEFHKALEEKGYTDISQFSVTKSDVRESKYFVNFVSDGYVYDAYFTKKGEIIEIYKMAKIQ